MKKNFTTTFTSALNKQFWLGVVFMAVLIIIKDYVFHLDNLGHFADEFIIILISLASFSLSGWYESFN